MKKAFFSSLLIFFVLGFGFAQSELLDLRFKNYGIALKELEKEYDSFVLEPWESDSEFETRRAMAMLSSATYKNFQLKVDELFDSWYEIPVQNVDVEFGEFDREEKSWKLVVESKDAAFPCKGYFHYSIKDAKDLREEFLNVQKNIDENTLEALIRYKISPTDIAGIYLAGGIDNAEVFIRGENLAEVKVGSIFSSFKFSEENRQYLIKQSFIETELVPLGIFQRNDNAENTSIMTKPYLMGKYPVTREQFRAVLGEDPSHLRFTEEENDPVSNVNWYQAIAFCNRLSLLECLEPVYDVPGVDFYYLNFADIPKKDNEVWNNLTCNWDASGYRLPTEMEWLWAAMGADLDSQPNAIVEGVNVSGFKKKFAGYNGENYIWAYAWTDDNSYEKTHPVGRKSPNELGLYDMTGNVRQWCWDFFDVLPDKTLIDYKNSKTGAKRAIRGSSFDERDSMGILFTRAGETPSRSYFANGFRVVKNQ